MWEWTIEELRAIDAEVPVVARLEAVGAQVSTAWGYTEKPHAACYPGGTGQGTLNFMPGGVGMEQVLKGKIPATAAQPYFNILSGYAYLSFGTPTDTGGIKNGFRISAQAGKFVIECVNELGMAKAPAALELKCVKGLVTVFGVPFVQ